MGIREWTYKHPKASGWIIGSFVVVCTGVIVAEAMGNRKKYPSNSPDAYFTTDDGKSYFVASTDNFPPFDHGGHQAVRAYVFDCGGKRFVGFLERYNGAIKKDLDSGKQLTTGMIRFGRELKRPSDTSWTPSGDLATETKIENVPCPDGNGTPAAIDPGD